MVKYRINDPVFDANGNIVENRVLTYTRQEILDEYWEHWKSRMEKKFGPDSPHINEENCIQDWTIIHWAWEVL